MARKYTKTVPTVYDAKLVWAAAAAAQRINGEYVKVEGEKTPNRTIMMNFLQTPELISEQDLEAGTEIRRYYNALTFKIMSGVKISEFDNNAMKVAQLEQIFSNYDLAVIASLPSCHQRSVARDKVNSRLTFETEGFVGKVGEKVTVEVEVVKCNYSANWNTYYITGITNDKKAVFFSYRQGMSHRIGSIIKVAGRVKAHRDNSSQLTRVKVI